MLGASRRLEVAGEFVGSGAQVRSDEVAPSVRIDRRVEIALLAPIGSGPADHSLLWCRLESVSGGTDPPILRVTADVDVRCGQSVALRVPLRGQYRIAGGKIAEAAVEALVLAALAVVALFGSHFHEGGRELVALVAMPCRYARILADAVCGVRPVRPGETMYAACTGWESVGPWSGKTRECQEPLPGARGVSKLLWLARPLIGRLASRAEVLWGGR